MELTNTLTKHGNALNTLGQRLYLLETSLRAPREVVPPQQDNELVKMKDALRLELLAEMRENISTEHIMLETTLMHRLEQLVIKVVDKHVPKSDCSQDSQTSESQVDDDIGITQRSIVQKAGGKKNKN